MELLTEEIYNLKIDKSDNDYIHKFSQLRLNELDLEPQKNCLVGFLFFKTSILPVKDYNKKYFMTVTNYFTEHKYKIIYPFYNSLELTSTKNSKNPKKLIKTKYGLKNSEIDKINLYEVYNVNNIIIYAVNTPKLFKFMKEMKHHKAIHLYSDPNSNQEIESVYSDIISTGFNRLNKRFFFFYNNIKISLKEKHILERIN